MYLYNAPEYAETNFAALKFRGVPINVNYRYLDDELHYLLDNADVEALVFHRSLGDRVARVSERARRAASAGRGRRRTAADGAARSDGGGRLRGTAGRRCRRPSASPPQGDELYIFYTGGTTGMPKGVMYPLREFTAVLRRGVPGMIGLPPLDAAELTTHAKRLVDAGTPSWRCRRRR